MSLPNLDFHNVFEIQSRLFTTIIHRSPGYPSKVSLSKVIKHDYSLKVNKNRSPESKILIRGKP